MNTLDKEHVLVEVLNLILGLHSVEILNCEVGLLKA